MSTRAPLNERELAALETRASEGTLSREEALALIEEVRRLRESRGQLLMACVEAIRADIPEDWTEEELQRRIHETIETVRAERRARGLDQRVPLESLTEKQREKWSALQKIADEIRTRQGPAGAEDTETAEEGAYAGRG
jgi:hypothetical protein